MIAKRRSYHTLRDFFLVIFKHKNLTAVIFMLSVSAASVSTFWMVPVHESFAKLMVRSTVQEALTRTAPDGDGLLRRGTAEKAMLDTAVEMLTGNHLIEKVISVVGVKTLYPDINRKSFFDTLSTIDRAILNFKKDLTVSRGTLIDVRFQHRNPAVAARVVNTLIDEFLDYYLSVQQQHQKYSFFKNQGELMKQKLQDSQRALGLFRNEHNISSVQKQKSLLLLQISDLEIEIARTQAEISRQESLASGSRETASIRKELLALKSKEKKMSQQTAQYKLALGRLDKAETQLRELERQVTLDEENYLLYAKKTEEARISSAMDEQKLINFSVIEPARPSTVPIKPNRTLLMCLAMLLGLVGGLLMAFVAEYFTHTFDNKDDIEEILGFPALASFPELTRPEQLMLKSLRVPERNLEECNRIKHSISRTIPGETRSFLFCSSNVKEGTSSVLLNLAVTLAAGGERVLVIDANLHNPSMHRLLGKPPADGLAEIVGGRISMEAAVQSTKLESLFLISGGSPPENPFELLQSEQFDDFLKNVQTQADWVLIDSPPIDAFNDSCVLASKVSAVIFVVKSGKTRWEVARSAYEQFRQCGAKVLGVLNRQRKYIPDWLYNRL